jgi:catechol 2,3-dioxygenase-like lactoylglutathione lyase family enzyme
MLRNFDAISFLATTDAAVSRAFYEDVLGLRLVSDEHFALVFDLNGRMLRIAKTDQLQPARHTVLGWAVVDITATVRDLEGHGIQFSRFDGMNQDISGIWTSPTGARVAWFKDPDGNALSLTQFTAVTV